jgi:hypothetical protein
MEKQFILLKQCLELLQKEDSIELNKQIELDFSQDVPDKVVRYIFREIQKRGYRVYFFGDKIRVLL